MAESTARPSGDNAVADGMQRLIFPLRAFDERRPARLPAQLLQSEGTFAEPRGFAASGETLIAAAFWKAIRIWRRRDRR